MFRQYKAAIIRPCISEIKKITIIQLKFYI